MDIRANRFFGHKCLHIKRNAYGKGKFLVAFGSVSAHFTYFFWYLTFFYTQHHIHCEFFFVAICIILRFDSFTWKSCAPIWYFNLVNASDAKITNTFDRIFTKNNCICYARIKTSWNVTHYIVLFFSWFHFLFITHWFVTDLVVIGPLVNGCKL